MDKELLHKSEQLSSKRKKKKIWKSIVSALACIVVFCTTYALILPAITMETKTFCGQAEHVHSDECYKTELVCTLSDETVEIKHEHDDSCYVEEKALVCGQKESEGHSHTDDCKKIDTYCVCGQEESEEHSHTDDCYMQDVSYICGQEESEGHSHTDDCYSTEKKLVCEKTTEEIIEEHVHGEACYEKVFVCDIEEHKHDKMCYSNPTADVETAEEWEDTLPEELTGIWAEDVLAVADSQLGYTESTKNYILDEEGEIKGYSRYGDWYGDKYGHWCAMFVSFCLDYAGVDEDLIPYDSNCQNWIDTLSEEQYNLYHEAGEYEPVPGDLIFFNWDNLPDSDHVGLVYEIIEATDEHGVQIKTIEGNASNTVKYRTYDIDDDSIMGYAQLPENPNPEEEEVEEEVNNLHTGYSLRSSQKAMSLANLEDAYAPENVELGIDWAENIAKVAESQIGTQKDSDGTIKYSQWYQEEFSITTSDWASMFVSYCMHYANVNTEYVPIYKGDSDQVWINELKNKGFYREKGTYIPKRGDLILYTFNNKQGIAVINKVSNIDYNNNKACVEFVHLDDNGCVVNKSNFWTDDGQLGGIIEIPRGELTTEVPGVLKADAKFEIGTVEAGTKLIVEIINGSQWDEKVKNSVETYGYELQNNHYLSVRFESADGKPVIPKGPVDISIIFSDPLESLGNNEWKTNMIDGNGDVVSTTSAYDITVNKSNEITALAFTYSDAQAIVLSEIEASRTTLAADTDLGKVRATYKTADMPEGQNVLMNVSFLAEDQYNLAWSEALQQKYQKSGYAMTAEKYFTIEFVDEAGNKVSVPEDTEIEIIFEPTLSAAFADGRVSDEGTWHLDTIASEDEKINATEIDAQVKMTDECALENISFTYKEAATYSLVSVVFDENAGNEVLVKNYEELKTAIANAGDGNTIIKIGNDFAVNDFLEIEDGKRIIIDLNGHTIQTTNTLFVVKDAILNIKDSKAVVETSVVEDAEVTVEELPETAGKAALYESQSKTLTYYVTESDVINSNTGETRESLVKHTVTLSGTITGGGAPIVVVESGTFNLASGALTDSGNRAILQKGGTVNLKGGYICGNSATTTDCTSDVSCQDGLVSGGAVYITGDSRFNLSGAVIAANSATERGGAIGVGTSNNAVVNIIKGVISGNECTTKNESQHDAVNDGHTGGGGISLAGNAVLNLSGGYITNNRVNATGYYDGGGAVFVKNGCYINIAGTYVTGNYSNSSGGGIYTAADFIMTDGHVNGNYAKLAEGGGIAVNEPAYAYVYGGYINNNRTDTDEHWGGGGLFCANGSNLIMERVLVTENNAGGYGGGVAGCSTGRVYLFVKEGAAIYSNTASGTNLSGETSDKHEDITAVDKDLLKYGFEDYFCALNSVVENYMLGGNPANWKGSIDGVPVEAGEDDTLVATYVMLLKSHPTSGAIIAAQQEARIYINGNDSNTHGGGILANGYLVIGEEGELPVYSRIELQASKALLGDKKEEIELKENQFQFVIENADTGAIVSTAGNDADGKIIFGNRIPFTEEGTFTYLVYEKPDVGNEAGIVMDSTTYRITVTVDKQLLSDMASTYKRYFYKITNLKVEKKQLDEWNIIKNEDNPSYVEEKALVLSLSDDKSFKNYQISTTKISALKKWVGCSEEEMVPVSVQLYRAAGEGEGVPQGEPVELNSKNGWYYSWGNLPLYEADSSGNKTYYTYSVKEIGEENSYYVTYETVNHVTRNEAWIPATGKLAQYERCIVVSGDGKHLLRLSDRNSGYDLGVKDQQSLVKKGKAITINGMEYTDYYLSSEIDANSIYIYDYHNGQPVLKHNGGAWQLLTAPNGTLKSSYDTSNLYIGNYSIGYGASNSTEYKVVYEGNKFTAVQRVSSHNNEAAIYEFISGEETTETVFTITNTKIPDDKEFKLDITKVSEKDNMILLPGAEFSLYYADDNGDIRIENGVPVAVTFLKQGASSKYKYCTEGTEGATQNLITDSYGKLILDKLPEGKYVLRETKAPNGYLPIDDMKITLDDSTETSIKLTIEDDKEQEEGFILPETGGSGTNTFTITGILLLMISILLYIKMKNQMKGGQSSTGN